MSSKIDGGYILTARKLLESEVMSKPPLYAKLWIWMLMKAKFSNHNGLKRGQFFTSTSLMQEAMSFMVGYRKTTPTKKQIRGVYDSLVKGRMIVITKVTHGVIVSICNYNFYQDPKNYEGHDEGHDEGEGGGTIRQKEGKEGKEGKEIIVPAGPEQDRCPHLKIIEIYHETLPELSKVNEWPEHCQKTLRAHWKEKKDRQDLEWWKIFFKSIKKMPFLLGQKTDFQASLQWMIGPKNFSKIINGFYLDRSGSGHGANRSSRKTAEESWNDNVKPIYGLDYCDRHKLPELKKIIQANNKKRIKK